MLRVTSVSLQVQCACVRVMQQYRMPNQSIDSNNTCKTRRSTFKACKFEAEMPAAGHSYCAGSRRSAAQPVVHAFKHHD